MKLGNKLQLKKNLEQMILRGIRECIMKSIMSKLCVCVCVKLF